MMQAIIPYLNFNGNAAEALDFYAKALDGSVVSKQTFADAPFPTEDNFKDKILHAVFVAGELSFMVSDCPPGVSVTNGSSVSLSINFSDEESVDKTFAAMAEGGVITIPLEKTFWGAKFGMLTDQFGINWMFNYDYEQK